MATHHVNHVIRLIGKAFVAKLLLYRAIEGRRVKRRVLNKRTRRFNRASRRLVKLAKG